MEITHIHSPALTPSQYRQTDALISLIAETFAVFMIPSFHLLFHKVSCDVVNSFSHRDVFRSRPRPFRDCSKKPQRGKRDRVPNHALVSVFAAVAVALFFSGVRKSPIYHRRLRNRVCTRKKKKGREGRRATKKCLDFWGNSEWPRGIPPKLASLSLRLLHLFNAAAFGFGFAVATACGRSLTLTSKALSVKRVLLLF